MGIESTKRLRRRRSGNWARRFNNEDKQLGGFGLSVGLRKDSPTVYLEQVAGETQYGHRPPGWLYRARRVDVNLEIQ